MDKVDLKKITTEARNKDTLDIDKISTIEVLQKINNEDKKVPLCVEKCIPSIAKLVDQIVKRFKKGGRLIYVGAGTSGRMGLIDAAECHPTFSCSFDMIQGLMAGGKDAIIEAAEGAEDDTKAGIVQLKNIKLSRLDTVIGIAASGRTPYTVSCIEYANRIGALTGCITVSKNSILAKKAKYPIECITGPEVFMGSTRMKGGSAEKIITNMISSASMVKMGRVYSNLLTDMMVTNSKITERAKNVVVEGLGVSYEEAEMMLKKYGTIKYALFSGVTGLTDLDKIKKILDKHQGNFKESVEYAIKHI